MSELASRGQLRIAFMRWALLLVPGIVLLGLLSAAMANSGPGNAWFVSLAKPATYPPPQTFAVVWTVLYVLMGLALAMLVSAWGAKGRGLAIAVFAVQLLLNLAWSPLFFGFHRIVGALALIAVLDLLVLATILLAVRVRWLAAALLVPYLAWILFATLLNWQFHQLNPDADGQPGPSAVVHLQF